MLQKLKNTYMKLFNNIFIDTSKNAEKKDSKVAIKLLPSCSFHNCTW